MTLGERLQKAREKLKKTQAQIADEIGCTQAAVAHWEAGNAKPDPSKWRAVADAYRVRFELLVEEIAA